MRILDAGGGNEPLGSDGGGIGGEQVANSGEKVSPSPHVIADGAYRASPSD